MAPRTGDPRGDEATARQDTGLCSPFPVVDSKSHATWFGPSEARNDAIIGPDKLLSDGQ